MYMHIFDYSMSSLFEDTLCDQDACNRWKPLFAVSERFARPPSASTTPSPPK